MNIYYYFIMTITDMENQNKNSDVYTSGITILSFSPYSFILFNTIKDILVSKKIRIRDFLPALRASNANYIIVIIVVGVFLLL